MGVVGPDPLPGNRFVSFVQCDAKLCESETERFCWLGLNSFFRRLSPVPCRARAVACFLCRALLGPFPVPCALSGSFLFRSLYVS